MDADKKKAKLQVGAAEEEDTAAKAETASMYAVGEKVKCVTGQMKNMV